MTANPWLTGIVSIAAHNILFRSFSLNGLIQPNTVYYWKINHRNESESLGVNEGDINSFSLSTLSNENYGLNNVSIHPNPSKDLLYINNIKVNIEDYKIFNTLGHLVLEGKLDSNNTIDIKNLDSGLYILKIYSQNGISHISKKIIKE